jgi:hypothetical protein
MLFAQTPGWVSTGTNLHVNSFTTNVGIGTAAPACRLEVWKSSSDVNYPNVPCLGLFNDNSSGLSKSEIVFGNAFIIQQQKELNTLKQELETLKNQ